MNFIELRANFYHKHLYGLGLTGQRKAILKVILILSNRFLDTNAESFPGFDNFPTLLKEPIENDDYGLSEELRRMCSSYRQYVESTHGEWVASLLFFSAYDILLNPKHVIYSMQRICRAQGIISLGWEDKPAAPYDGDLLEVEEAHMVVQNLILEAIGTH